MMCLQLRGWIFQLPGRRRPEKCGNGDSSSESRAPPIQATSLRLADTEGINTLVPFFHHEKKKALADAVQRRGHLPSY